MLTKIILVYNDLMVILNMVLKALMIFLMALITVIVLAQVFFRYVLFASLRWSEELTRYSMIWLVMISAGYAMSYWEHIEAIFIKKKLGFNDAARKVLNIVIYFLVILVLVIFFLNSYDLANRVDVQLSPALRISMFWPYLAMPVGSLIMLLQAVKLLLNEIFNIEIEEEKLEEGL